MRFLSLVGLHNCGIMTGVALLDGAEKLKEYTMTKKTNFKLSLVLAIAVLLMAAVLTGCGSKDAETPAPSTMAVPTVEPVAAAAGGPTATTTTDTYVRTGPGTDYPAYGIASAGKSAKVLGKSGDGQWYAVELPTEYVGVGYGWVFSGNVTVSNVPADMPVYPSAPVPPQVPVEPITSGEPQVTANEAVYVRSGPGEIYPAYGIAQKGATGRVIGKSTDGLWWQVALPTTYVGAGNGWASAVYTTATNVENVPVVPNPPLPPVINVGNVDTSGPYVTCITGVNVRSAPSTDATVYGVAPVGARFQAIGVSADYAWYQVAIPTNLVAAGNGWVSADYVVAVNTGSLPVVNP